MREYRVSDHPATAPLRKSRFKLWGIQLSLVLLIVSSAPVYSQSPTPSIFCGAVHHYVCTPEQAIAEQRRQMQRGQMQRRDPSARPEGQQAYGQWFYMEQMQRQRMEQRAFGAVK